VALRLGARVYGLGVMALAAVCLVWGTFDPGQPVPEGLPQRTALAYVVAAFLLVAGAAITWRRTAAKGAAAVTAYYAVVVVVWMQGRLVISHYGEYGMYSGIAEQLSIAAGGVIVYAASARLDAVTAARLTRVGQIAFGVCALLFGGAHFVYLDLTTPLVPRWLPPSQELWAYATGVGFIAAGLALLSGVQARLAAILLTVMLAAFTVLVHAPLIIAEPSSHGTWAEGALNLVVNGVAWVVADSLGSRQPPRTCERPVPAFERPVPAFERPVSAFQRPVSAFERPVSAFERPVSAFERPVTAFERPVRALERPVSALKRPVSALKRPVRALEGPVSALKRPVRALERPSLP
jgi:uncharacterized membrane protein YphA (DoxX/SURF4 family)/exonuclease VII small subunit